MNINIIEIIKKQIYKIDNKIYIEYKDKKEYVFKGYRNKKIVTLYGSFKIKRRIYYNKLIKKYEYPLDKKLGYSKYTHYDQEVLKLLHNLVIIDNVSYRNIKNYLKSNISISQIKTLLLKYNARTYIPKITDPHKYKNLYVSIDDTYTKYQSYKKKYKGCFRIVCVHQGKINNQYKNKLLLCFKMHNNDTYRFYLQLKSILSKYYGNTLEFNIIVLGDAGLFVKKIANLFSAHYILDKFHFHRSVKQCFNFYSKYKKIKSSSLANKNEINLYLYKTFIRCLKNNNYEQIKDFYNLCQNKFQQIKFKKLYKFVLNNKKAIFNLYDSKSNYDKVCLTETNVQSILKHINGGVAKIYSLDILKKIISIKSIPINL